MHVGARSGREDATVREDVANRLRQAIIEGRYPGGAHLSDRAMCEEFGVSRSMFREAVRVLEGDGLVTSIPNRGLFVTTLTAADAVQIYEVRSVLEAFACDAFAMRASEHERAALQTALDALSRTSEQTDLLRLKHEFYAILFEGCRNVFVGEVLTRFFYRIQQLRLTSMASPGRLPNSIRELRQIVAAIQDRDGPGAAEASRQHVKCAASAALAVLREREAGLRTGGKASLADGRKQALRAKDSAPPIIQAIGRPS